jgi:hypothetical protein
MCMYQIYSNLVSFTDDDYKCIIHKYLFSLALSFFLFFFEMSTQEGEGGFKLVTTTSLGVVLAD